LVKQKNRYGKLRSGFQLNYLSYFFSALVTVIVVVIVIPPDVTV